MGSQNINWSISPLHAMFEALLWAMDSMNNFRQLEAAFKTNSSELVKMVSTPEVWSAFQIDMEEFQRCKTFFNVFHITITSHMTNSVAKKIARSAVHIDLEFPYRDMS